MIKIRRYKHRRKVIVTITWPDNLGRNVVTAMLLIVSLAGIIYSIGPAIFHRAETQVLAEAKQPSAPQKRAPVLGRSEPVSLEAPDIGLTTDLIQLGKNDDGTLAVPDRYDIAAWYKFSPTPGEVGPAVIVGHVDNYLGPAIFFNLKNLQPGQMVYINRTDGSRVPFKVDSLELVDQQNFPTQRVYGNIDHAGLRLITCGGDFDPIAGRYLGNTVVYATYAPET